MCQETARDGKRKIGTLDPDSNFKHLKEKRGSDRNDIQKVQCPDFGFHLLLTLVITILSPKFCPRHKLPTLMCFIYTSLHTEVKWVMHMETDMNELLLPHWIIKMGNMVILFVQVQFSFYCVVFGKSIQKTLIVVRGRSA